MNRKKNNSIEDTKSALSIINNFRMCPDSLVGAAEAKYYLSRMHDFTGETQQAVICRCINYAMRNMPEYAGICKKLEKEFKAAKKH